MEYTVTVLDSDRCVIAQAYGIFTMIGPAKSQAREYARDKEYIAAGAQKVEVTVGDSDEVVFDLPMEE